MDVTPYLELKPAPRAVFERLRTPDMATRKVVLGGRLVVRGSSGARAAGGSESEKA